MSKELPLLDSAKLLLNWFSQRRARCLQLGYPADADRYASYESLVRRLALAAGLDIPF